MIEICVAVLMTVGLCYFAALWVVCIAPDERKAMSYEKFRGMQLCGRGRMRGKQPQVLGDCGWQDVRMATVRDKMQLMFAKF